VTVSHQEIDGPQIGGKTGPRTQSCFVQLYPSSKLSRDPIRGGQYPRWDADGGCVRGNVVDDQGICRDYCAITYFHYADDARIAGDKNVIADNGSAWSRSGPDGAPMIERAVGSNLRGPVNADSTDMRYQQARTDFSGRIDINVCNQREKFSCDG
jgi:hypothetical protein